MFTGTPSPLRVRVPAGFLRVLARNPGFPTPWRLPRVAHLPMWRIPKSPPPPMIDVSRTPHPRWRITDRWDHMIEPRFSPLQTSIRPGDRFVHPSDPPRTRNMFRGSVTSSWPGTEPCLPPRGRRDLPTSFDVLLRQHRVHDLQGFASVSTALNVMCPCGPKGASQRFRTPDPTERYSSFPRSVRPLLAQQHRS